MSLWSLGGQALGAIGNIVGAQQQFKNNRKLAQEEHDRNVSMWNMQNEYNSYSAQMGRMRQAGLNPRLMYGEGAGSSNASTAPEYKRPEAPNYMDKAMQGMQMTSNAIGLLSALEDMKGKKIDNQMKAIDASMYGDTYLPGEMIYNDDGSLNKEATVYSTTRPGTASLKRSLLHSQFRSQDQQYRLGEMYGFEQAGLRNSQIRSAIANAESQIGLRALQGENVSSRTALQRRMFNWLPFMNILKGFGGLGSFMR